MPLHGSIDLADAQRHWKRRAKLHRQHRRRFTTAILLSIITIGIFSYSLLQVQAGTVNLSLVISGANVCGDGIVDSGEECDDSNRVSSDGCSAQCQRENSGGGTTGGGTSIIRGSAPIFPIPPLPRVTPPKPTESPIPIPTTPLTKFEVQLFSMVENKIIANFDKSNSTAQIPTMINNRPVFRGSSGTPNALIRLVLRSNIISTVIQADTQGNWHWQPTAALADGAHELLITVYDPSGTLVLIPEISIRFIIDSTNSGRYTQPLQDVINNTKQNDQQRQQLLQDNLGFGQPLTYYSLTDYVPFDLRVSVAKNYKPGEDLMVRLVLNQYRSEQGPDKSFTYIIRDQNGQIVWQKTETLQVRNQTNIITTLHPEVKIDPGVYQLEVSVPDNNTSVVASTYLQIAIPTSPLLETVEINWLMVSQTAAALLILFLLAIFFEYRYLQGLGRFNHPITEADLKSLGYLT